MMICGNEMTQGCITVLIAQNSNISHFFSVLNASPFFYFLQFLLKPIFSHHFHHIYVFIKNHLRHHSYLIWLQPSCVFHLYNFFLLLSTFLQLIPPTWLVFVKDSVLYCLRTRQRAPKVRGTSALARVRFAESKPIHFGSQW